MSDYKNSAVNPKTNKIEEADFWDDYYGRHKYGVEFEDGGIYPLSEITVSEEHFANVGETILKPSDRVFHFRKVNKKANNVDIDMSNVNKVEQVIEWNRFKSVGELFGCLLGMLVAYAIFMLILIGGVSR
ncbi:MAG: hypothetical protein NUV65_03570 [Candidatus Roizmanbacteria bacterium]|nr:hypothetical protein [Candidatus Roizmanbacteria bacterium]